VVVSAAAGAVTLRVSGEIDCHEWESVERALLSCLWVEADDIVVDLSDVGFMSASACPDLHRAICSLLEARKRVVVVASAALTRVVELLTVLGAIPAGAASVLGGDRRPE
jgi:anti-anti-sigma factor